MKIVKIYTDGSCLQNPGPGGWGAVLIYNDKIKELSGGEADTTNNRMELTSVIKALSCLKFPCRAEITTDSKYVCDAFNKKWVYSWERNNWKKSDGKMALNIDLWTELLELSRIHECSFEWIKGHAGHLYNERCDTLARREAEKIKSQILK